MTVRVGLLLLSMLLMLHSFSVQAQELMIQDTVMQPASDALLPLYGLEDSANHVALRLGNTGTETRLGIVFSTQSGEKLLLSLEPALGFHQDAGGDAPHDIGEFSLTPTAPDIGNSGIESYQSLSLSARAEYDITPSLQIRAQARLETTPDDGNGKDTRFVGGFLTGLRF